MWLVRRILAIIGHVEIVVGGVFGSSIVGAYVVIADFIPGGWAVTVLQMLVMGLLFASLLHIARRRFEKTAKDDMETRLRLEFADLEEKINDRFDKAGEAMSALYALERKLLQDMKGTSRDKADDILEGWIKREMEEKAAIEGAYDDLVELVDNIRKFYPGLLRRRREE